MNNIPTGKRHQGVWDSNSKLATGRTAHIVQIAAVSGDKKFECYVMPKIPFDSSASDITWITKQGNLLFHNGKNVEAKSITDGLDDFLTFLYNQGNSINLYGHNIKTFDCHVLFNALEKAKKMDKFKSIVSSFMDTKLLLKSQFPGLPSYSQQSLVTKFLNEEHAAHNAIEDVSSLQKLVCSISRNEDSIKKSIFSVDQALFSFVSLKLERMNLPSLKCLVDNAALSKTMAKKVASSGLNYAALKLAYSRNEQDGIRQVLTEQCVGKPRVTKCSKIIQSICIHFQNVMSEN